MKLFDLAKDFFLSSDEEDELNESAAYDDEPRQERPARSSSSSASSYSASSSSSSSSSYGTTAQEREEAMNEVARRNKVVNIQATAQLQVVLVKPSAFTDAKQIADHLIAKKTVVLNLETASPDNKRRIIDFLGGVAYANGGSLKPVANLTYIITPYNVGFIGEDLVGELENNGVFI
ncbi:MAG: cell division protein SepF [Ruminococcus sp.]|nr:cell division protein SepF [Ruminococcus sp.]